MCKTMLAAYLPGDRTVELKHVDIPVPGHGEVLIRVKASTICGSEVKVIYRAPKEKRTGALGSKIAGHEPCGQIVQCGPGMRRFKEGDRVIVYHISGCGICYECRRGYFINCSRKRTYGWDHDGSMSEYLLADEKDLIPLPYSMSYIDGAMVSCGFGTVYEGIENIGVSGKDTVLVVGVGPVGMAALMLAKAMGAKKLIGVDTVKERLDIALEKGIAHNVFLAGENTKDEIMKLTGGKGVEKSLDCSGNSPGRLLAVQSTGRWGRTAFIGEHSTFEFAPSTDLMHDQKSIFGSWVTTIWRMEELALLIAEWGIHPGELVTHKFPLEKASEAYDLMDKGRCGKVAIVFDEIL